MKRLIALLAFVLCLTDAQLTANAQDEYDIGVGRRPGGNRVGVPSRWRGSPQGSRIRTASHLQEEVVAGDVTYEGDYVEGDYIQDDYVDGGYIESGCDSCGGGGCDSCCISDGCCDNCSAPRGFCICFPSHGWVQVDYLNWYQKGVNLPALVSTGPAATRGVIGQAGTTLLYGGDSILTDERDGIRVRFGWWLGNFPGWGIEAEHVGLDNETERFFTQSTGTPIISRPFFDVTAGQENSVAVAFPVGVGPGSILIESESRLQSGAVRLRRQLLGCESVACSFLRGHEVPTSSRLDFTLGYRFWQLDDQINIQDNNTVGPPALGRVGTLAITDRFRSKNQFNGFEFGFLWQARRGWWSLDALARLSVGNVLQTVDITGSTTRTQAGVVSTGTGGVLALPSNIGSYSREEFTMVPELGFTLGYQLTRRIRTNLGYSMIYWGNVARAGEQIDRNINPNQFPFAAGAVVPPNRPQFQFEQTDYWVQGLSFGGEFRW